MEIKLLEPRAKNTIHITLSRTIDERDIIEVTIFGPPQASFVAVADSIKLNDIRAAMTPDPGKGPQRPEEPR